MADITDISIHHRNVPLAEVLEDAKHGAHTHFELVIVTITTADGETGTGYTYTGGKGGRAI
ncbi:MAG: uroporphyrinogen decarboxylase, partial [Pseudomonadota bacterium]